MEYSSRSCIFRQVSIAVILKVSITCVFTLEQPVGVGFSYTNSSDEIQYHNDGISASDNVLIIKTFFERFPERANNHFIISSESYGGHYIPQWTLKLFDENTLIDRFDGFLLGNPYVSYATLYLGMIDAAWGLQLIPLPSWKLFNEHDCDSLDMNPLYYPEICFGLLYDLLGSIATLNPYALTYPTCDQDTDAMNIGGKEFNDKVTKKVSMRKIRMSSQSRYLIAIHNRISKEFLALQSIKNVRKDNERDDISQSQEEVTDHEVTFSDTVSSQLKHRDKRVKISSNQFYKIHNKLTDVYHSNGIVTFAGNISYEPCGEDYLDGNYLCFSLR